MSTAFSFLASAAISSGLLLLYETGKWKASLLFQLGRIE